MNREQLDHAIRAACQIIEQLEVIEGVAGEWSPFEEQHGFSIDGVDLTTVVLPDGWRTRLVKVQNANTAGPTGHPRLIGWCLEPHDLCAAKLCAGREKDLNFVRALIEAKLVDRVLVGERVGSVMAQFEAPAERAKAWLASFDRDN